MIELRLYLLIDSHRLVGDLQQPLLVVQILESIYFENAISNIDLTLVEYLQAL